MVALRWLLCALIGVALYQMLVVLGGVLVAIATPAGYFDFFGAQHKELALGVWSTATFAVPLGLLAWVGTRLWLWAARRVGHSATRGDRLAYVLGAVMLWLFWQLSYFLAVDTSTPLTWGTFWTLFWNTHVLPLWHLPSAWASWVGIAVGLHQGRSHTHAQQARGQHQQTA